MQLHEIDFKPLEQNPGWYATNLPGGYRIWRNPEGCYAIERRESPTGRFIASVIYNADALTAQCILHDMFK